MDVGAAGGVIIAVSVIAGVSILFGFVGLGLFGRWFVEKSLSTLEAAVGLAGLLVAMLLVLTLPPAYKLLPPLLAAGLWGGLQGWIARREREREREHLERAVQRARTMLERDPTVAVAYEKLAQALEALGQPDQALEVLYEYRRRLRVDQKILRWMVKLEVSLYGAPKTEVPDRPQRVAVAAEPAPPATASADAVAASLAAFDEPAPAAPPIPPEVAFAPPADEPAEPQPQHRQPTREEQEMEAFAPPDETPDVAPDFAIPEPVAPAAEPEPEPPRPAGPAASRDRHGTAPEPETSDPLAPAFETPAEADAPFYRPGETAQPTGERVGPRIVPPQPAPPAPLAEDESEPFLSPAEAATSGSKVPLWEDPLAPAYGDDQTDQPFYRPPEATTTPHSRPLTPPPPPAARRPVEPTSFSNDPNRPAFDESDDDGQGAFYNPSQEQAELGKPAPPPKPPAKAEDPDEGKPAP